MSASHSSELNIYSNFMKDLGPSIFSLWKCCLLNKRILFYSTPPIIDLCSKVFCAFDMLAISIDFMAKKQLIKPFFYVNVVDIEVLQQESFFIACKKKNFFF